MAEQIGKLKPVLTLLVVLAISAFLGYIWGASGVNIADTGIWQLHISYQGIYVQAVADAYALDNNDALAIDRLSFICQANDGLSRAFEEANLRYGSDVTKKRNLDQLYTLVASNLIVQNPQVDVCRAKPTTSWVSFGSLVGPIVIALMALIIVVYGILIVARSGGEPTAAVPARPASVGAPAPSPAAAPAPPRPGAPPPPSPAGETQPSAAAARPRAALPSLPGLGRKKEEPTEPRSVAAMGAQLSKAAEKTDFEAQGQEPPIVQFMTTYLHGDDLYDDSFSIETSSGEFLGETGVGVSETIGSTGEAKNVTALEVWLFDKNDIRTVTKVLMSDHAFNDDAIRAKLAPKGEAVLARTGDRLLLETATLRIQARIVDLAYKAGAMPPNGVIDRITIELAAWRREAQAVRPSASGGLSGSSTPPTGLPSISGS